MFYFNGISQGLYNNSAVIFGNSGSVIYVDGDNGHYTSVSTSTVNGFLNTTATITVMGNWINNCSYNRNIANQSTVILAGNITQLITGSMSTRFTNLSLRGNGLKKLDLNTNLTGVLSLGSSTLMLNANTLFIENNRRTAITFSAGGYIESETYTCTSGICNSTGTINWSCTRSGETPKIFPFGANGSFLPVTVVMTPTNQTFSTLEVSTRDTYTVSGLVTDKRSNSPYEPPVTNLDWVDGTGGSSDRSITGVLDRWWTIKPSSSFTADITFTYRSSENTTSSPSSNIGAQYWNTSTSSWLPNHNVLGEVPGVTSGTGTVTAPGLTFSAGTKVPFILSSKAVALPIELIDFSGKCIQKELVLDWCTASEKNNHFFTVEHSLDGVNFSSMGRIYGNGTTGEKHCYQFITNALGELNYYRLKQTDYDGSISYSKIIVLKSCQGNANQVIIAHEGKKQLSLIINSISNQTFQLKLHNTLGQIIEEKTIEIKEGYNNLPVNFENLSNAIYYVSIYNGVEKLISKQIVVSDFSR